MQMHFNYNSQKIYNYNVGIMALHIVFKQLKIEFLFWMAEFWVFAFSDRTRDDRERGGESWAAWLVRGVDIYEMSQ